MSNGPGSKPAALHTEYVEQEVGGPAYGTQDLVFYLLRADQDATDSGLEEEEEEQLNIDTSWQGWDAIEAELAADASAQTGPGPDRTMQSGAQQVAMSSVGRSVGGSARSGYSMGPMSGMNYTDGEPLGAVSQNASLSVDVGTAVRNAIRSVPSLESQATNLGLASSERMFNGILRRNYSRDSLDGARGSVEDILESAEKPPTAELAFLLARESGGVTRVRDLAAGVNDGSIGLVTPKSRAFQERMGPSGAPRRR